MDHKTIKSWLLILLFASNCFAAAGDTEIRTAGGRVIWNNNSFKVSMAASPSATESVNYILPTADGDASQTLITNGVGVLDWADVNAVAGTHALLSITHTDTAGSAVARGAIVYGNTSTKWDALTVGAADTFLKSDGTDVAWSTLTVSDPVTLTGATIGWDSTLIDATTWSDGANASNIWTFDVSGTDHTMTLGNDLVTFSAVVAVTGIADGGFTNYDLKVGDTDGSPTYGMIQIGNASIGRTSFRSGDMDIDGTLLYRNISGPVTGEIEHVFVESTGSTTRFALAKAGVGNATYNSRSLLLAGPAPADTNYVKVSYWQTTNSIFDKLVCDTAGTGADFGVQNDIQLHGDLFGDSIKESTTGSGITFGNSITVTTGNNITLGTTQWNSSDEIDGTKIKDADYGDVDVSAGGAWTVSSVQANSVALGTDTTGDYVSNITGGAGIDSTGATTGETISHTLSFDSTEVSGNRTWGDASTDTIVWTWDRATGTDPNMIVGTGVLTFNGDLTAVGFRTGVTGYIRGGIVSDSGSVIAIGAVGGGADGRITIQSMGEDIRLESGEDLVATSVENMTFTPASTKTFTVTTSGLNADITLDSGNDSDVILTGSLTTISSVSGLNVNDSITVGGTLELASASITDAGGTINFGNEILSTTGQGQFSSVLITGINQATVNTDATDTFTITGGDGGAGSGVSGIAGAGSDNVKATGDGGVAANLDGVGGRGGNDSEILGAGGANTHVNGFAAGDGGGFIRLSGPGGNASGGTSGDGGDSGDLDFASASPGTSVSGSAGSFGNMFLMKNGGNIRIGSSATPTALLDIDSANTTTLIDIDATALAENDAAMDITSNERGLRVVTTDERAIFAQATSGTAFQANTTTGDGFSATATGGGMAASLALNVTAANTELDIAELVRRTTGTAAAGIGGSLDFKIESDGGATETAVSIAAVLTDVTAGAEISKAIFRVRDGLNGEEQKFEINKDGVIIGGGQANVDPTITANGETNSGVITWDEDDDFFKFSDDIGLDNFEELRFYDDGGNYVGFEAPALSANQIWVLPTADGDPGAVLTTNGSGTTSWTDNPSEKTWAFMSRDASSGTNYIGGFYDFGGDEDLTNASTTSTHGTANLSYAAHAIAVSSAAGVTDGSDLVLTVTGTSITDAGVRTAADSEVIIADCTAESTNDYSETIKKWIGTITYTLSSTGGGTFNHSFNSGFAKYWDNNNTAFKVVGIEATWLGAKNDATPDIELRHHKATGWTYNNGADATPPTAVASMATDHNTEIQIGAAEEGAWKRDNLSTNIDGANDEGTIIELTTTTNRTYAIGNFLVRITPQ